MKVQKVYQPKRQLSDGWWENDGPAYMLTGEVVGYVAMPDGIIKAIVHHDVHLEPWDIDDLTVIPDE